MMTPKLHNDFVVSEAVDGSDIAPVLVVLAIGAWIGLASVGLSQVFGWYTFPSNSTTNNGTQQTAPVSMPKGVGSDQSLNFQPATVYIVKGGKVTWTNNDPVSHTVTSPSGAQTFDSGNMDANATYTVTFRVDGTYNYVCSYHPWMHGTVIVTG
jgi:plastocyanin